VGTKWEQVMRIVKLFKENLTLLTSVIVAFALGMGFAYALSAYFLAWEYSPETVETLSALGVFLTPIVALWIFTRWRQQKHAERLMDQVVNTMEALLECRYGAGDYANRVLSEAVKLNPFDSYDEGFNKIKTDEAINMMVKFTTFTEERNKLGAIQNLLSGKCEAIKLPDNDFSSKEVIDFVDNELEKLETESDFDVKASITEAIHIHNNQFRALTDQLASIYKKG